ncbi:major facilitator superfamily transporter [Colletotrichum graminicola]|uniref:Major facilitator superfamily transporter n=1 Tax=Colletotrichum graminicola (strain M1.001 / M2 / FGSC 10212) TaxID=645133 RepID=E3QK23_COLGM|nr:major facilitator superfamily transporter [Colletotrichum graminicola M1.001]EFQ31211.1 major facilitator superfamily transporter [Colletotrichum graminicola M1.001]WDK19202.1 major facilitator superfamily transporter [Colletotrichum graminicola]
MLPLRKQAPALFLWLRCGRITSNPMQMASGTSSEEKHGNEQLQHHAGSTDLLSSSEPDSSREAEKQPQHDVQLTVHWDEPEGQDPENPMNWRPLVKWANILTISVISFLVPLVSSMLAPAVPQVMAEFQTTSATFATFVVSIFVLGFACGPLLLAPLSELYGRVPVYNATNVLFLAATIMCAVSHGESMLLFSRFLSGFAGVATITIGSGTIADLMPRDERGRAVSIWSVGTILGPMVGPVIGGSVTERLGWRWMFFVISIVIGVVCIIAFLVLRETYPPVLLERKAARIRKETGNPNYRSSLTPDYTPGELFRRSIARPMRLLLCCPFVTVLCAYVAVLYGTLYLLFATYSFVFTEVYGFSTVAVGLVFLPGGLATLCGAFYVGAFSDRTLKRRAAARGVNAPEDRLAPIITLPGALAFPAGLFAYGWLVEGHIHWAAPLAGTAVTGFGSILVFTGIQTYLIDAFEGYAASAVGANAVLRGIAGAVIPLSGLGLYERLGWGWGNSLLAFLAMALAPLPLVYGVYGARIRNMPCNKVTF